MGSSDQFIVSKEGPQGTMPRGKTRRRIEHTELDRGRIARKELASLGPEGDSREFLLVVGAL
jgi:hypothetical protein